MPFHECVLNDIIYAIKKIINNSDKCYRDEYDRSYSGTVVYWGGMEYINPNTFEFDELLISELTKSIDGLSMVSDDNHTVLKINDSYIMMTQTIDFHGDSTDFGFTLLDYPDDIRGFDDDY